jgi:hypothetical protein
VYSELAAKTHVALVAQNIAEKLGMQFILDVG